MAKCCGATHCLNGNAVSDVDAEIRKIVGAKGSRQGDRDHRREIRDRARLQPDPRRRHLRAGRCAEREGSRIYTLPIHFNKVLTGSHGGDAVPHVDIPRLIRLIEAGRLSLEGLITHEFPLDDINSALDVVRRWGRGRVLLRIGGA